MLESRLDIHGYWIYPLQSKWRAKKKNLISKETTKEYKVGAYPHSQTVPSHSGTALPWICPCRWELQGRMLVSEPGAGGGRGGSTSHWGTGWSPPPGPGSAAHTPPSGSSQGPVRPPAPGPRLTWTGRVLWTDGHRYREGGLMKAWERTRKAAGGELDFRFEAWPD